MRKIRQALNDDSDPRKLVVTIPAKDYRFMAPVHTLNDDLKTNGESVQILFNSPFRDTSQESLHRWLQAVAWFAAGLAIIAVAILLWRWFHTPERSVAISSIRRPPRTLRDRPSLAVLPFINLSHDAEQDDLIDGITDDLINDLSRLTNLFVIARTSSFTYKGRALKAPQIGRELGVKYLLEGKGSVHKAGDSVRVNTQLMDGATGGLLWAAHYDRSLRDIFAIQDEIVQTIVTTLSRQVGGLREAHDSHTALIVAGPSGCYDPVDFGAVPDDGIDDSVPARQALDAASVAGGRVCFGHGRWRLSRVPGNTYNRFAALSIYGAHVEIHGIGPGTVLEVVGDQGGATTGVISVNPGAHDITIRDLAIDTSATTNTNEQFHAIEVGNGLGTGTVEDVRIEQVRFEHPGATDGSHKGDCLHIAGNTPKARCVASPSSE
jgi:TolB-like protein